jgi:hypothetical protein
MVTRSRHKVDVIVRVWQTTSVMAGFEIRGKLNPEAYPAWVFQRYKKATKKTDAEALDYILERWANLDQEAARYGVTLDAFGAFRQESEGGRVVPIRKGKPKKAPEAKPGELTERKSNGDGDR